MTVSDKLRLPCWDSVQGTDPRAVEGCPEQHDLTRSVCSGSRSEGVAKQLAAFRQPHFTPSIFWDEKIIFWLFFSLLFFVGIWHSPCVQSDRTSHVQVLWQARAPAAGRLAGMGTATGNVNTAAWAEQLWGRLMRVATTFEVSIGLALAVL